MIAAIYARRSKDQPGVSDEAKSVTRQVENATAYAERRGWTVVNDHIYVDDAIGGAEFEARRQFLRLMNSLKPKPPFQVLVMSEESRLGRESIETAYNLKQLVQAGVRLFFYLEDRERVIETPTDKLLLSITTFADEVEREKARQRTFDAMFRKARAGYVTGGRVFGYDNVEVRIAAADGEQKRSHVARRINEDEAPVVRRIFELCAEGYGKRRIAVTLNDARLPAPRAQQGRPRSWSPSSIHEILNRSLYRGEIVWNQSRKRNTWGAIEPRQRPQEQWLHVPAPELAIVPRELWDAAHRRMDAGRKKYLRATGGRSYGRPSGGVVPKYLLTGFLRCGTCGGGFFVKTRDHGKRRSFRYACSSYHKRGASACSNRLEAPLESTDELVLSLFEEEMLCPEVVDAVVDRAARAILESGDTTERRRRLRREAEGIEKELSRLTAAVAAGGHLDTLIAAIRDRERGRAAIEQALEALARSSPIKTSSADLRRRLGERLQNWRTLLREQVSSGRDILSTLLAEKVVMTPTLSAHGAGYYELRANLNYSGLFEGICPTGVASPAGFEPASPP